MKKLSIIAMCLVTSLLVACGGGSGSGEKYDLYYKLEPGKTYNQSISANMKMNQNVMGQNMDMSVTMSMGMAYAVTDTTGGQITCDMSFTSIEMKMNTPMGNFAFSSEKESDTNPMMPIDMYEMLKAMKNIKFGMSMTKYGEVESISGFEEMKDEIFGSMGLSYSEVEQAKALMEQSFSEEKMIDQMKNMSIYPKHPVAIGDSWEMKVENDQMDLDNTYTLKKVTDSEVVIDVKSKINRMSMAEQGISGALKGTQEGSTTAHRSSGWIKKATIKQDVSGDLTTQGMSVKMKMKSDITIAE